MVGEIGFDEGGVLAALFSKPFYSESTIYFKYRKGELIEQTTKSFDVSMGDVLVPMIIAGAVTLSVFSLEAIKDATKDWPNATPEDLTPIFGWLAANLKTLVSAVRPDTGKLWH